LSVLVQEYRNGPQTLVRLLKKVGIGLLIVVGVVMVIWGAVDGVGAIASAPSWAIAMFVVIVCLLLARR
jgi:hypothetical protein